MLLRLEQLLVERPCRPEVTHLGGQGFDLIGQVTDAQFEVTTPALSSSNQAAMQTHHTFPRSGALVRTPNTHTTRTKPFKSEQV